MSTTIDERVVEMRFDNKNFEANVKTSISTLDKLKQSLKMDGVSKGLEDVSKAAGKVDFSQTEIAATRAGFHIQDVFEKVTRFIENDIALRIVNAGKNLAKTFTIDPIKTGFSEYELKMGSVQTIMASTGATLQTVNQYLDELNTYSDKTIYSFSDMTQNIGKFTNAGVKLEDAVAAIKGISNEAAVSGANAQEASRAMYNFAQALSAGYVKLIDWKSIENANMATVEFKQQLIDTAVALGTLVKVGDKYKTTTTDANGKVSDLFDATYNFNDALSNQWMTTDVLTQTLSKYADETTEIGKKAYAAAQDVKTFSMMMDTLKEAAQSGWAQTWELLVGDFEEAKSLFTEASSFFGEIIDNMSTARNNFLKGALDNVVDVDDWLGLNEAGKATKNFRKLLKAVAKEHGVAIDDMIKEEGSFADTLKNGWLTDDIYTETINSMTDAEKELIEEQVSSIKNTEKRTKKIKELTKAVKQTDKPYTELLNKMSRTSGRELLIDSFRNGLQTLVTAITAVKDAWSDVFPPATSEQLYSIIERLHDFSIYLKNIDKDGSKLSRTFRGLFSVVHIISNLFGGAFKIGLKVVQAILAHFNIDILDVTASIGDALYNFDQWIEKNDFITNGVDKVITAIEKSIEVFDEWITTLKEIPQVQSGIEKFNNAYASAISSLDTRISGTSQRINEFIRRVNELDHVGLDNIGDIFKDFYDNVLSYLLDFTGIFKDTKKSFEDLQASAINELTESDNKISTFKDIIIKYATELRNNLENLDIFGPLLTIGTGVVLYKSSKRIMSVLEKLGGFAAAFKAPAQALTKVLTQLQTTLKAYAFELKSKAILNIALAISVLAGSLAVLSLCDANKLSNAAAALSVVTVALAGLCLVIGKFNIADVGKVSSMMLSMAGALLVLVIALKKMESLNMKGINERLIVLAKLGAGLLVFGGIASVLPGINKSAVSLLALAIAVRAMINALKKIDKLDLSNTKDIFIVLSSITASLSVLSVASKGLSLKSAVGLMAMAVSLRMVINSFQEVMTMDLDSVKKGIPALITIFGSFTGLVLVSKLAGKHAAQAGVMMLAISASLLIIVKTIKKIGKLSAHDIEKGTEAITGMMLVFAAVVAMSKFAGKHAAQAGVTLLGMAGTLLAVSVAIAIIGSLKDDEVERAKKAITGITACFALLIASTGLSKFDAGAKTSIMAMATTIGVLAVALGALSFIQPDRLKSSTIAMSTVMSMFALMTASTKSIGQGKGMTNRLLTMTAAVGILAGILYAIAKLPVKKALGAAGSLSLLLAALAGSMVVVSKIQNVSAKSLLALYAMSGVIAVLATILGVMDKLDVSPSIETASALSILLVSMSAMCLILSKVGPAARQALVGAAALDGVIAIIGGFILVIGALFSKDFMSNGKEYIKKGFDILNTIAYGLGSFVDNIVGGFTDGVMSRLPAIGTYLSEFADNAQSFFDSMTNLDPSIATSAKNLAVALLAICATEVVDAIAGWLIGASDLSGFGKKLKDFAQGLVDFSTTVKGKINAKSVEAATTAGKLITELADSVPNTGGLLGVFVGNNDVDKFGKQLKKFARGIVNFSTIVDGKINAESVEAATTAGKMITELADSVPNSKGLLGFLVGNNDVKKFGNQLNEFAQGLVDFSTTVKGNINVASVRAAVTAGKLVTELADSIPNSGGLLGRIVGNNSMKDFASQLKGFGDGLAGFCTSEFSKVSATELGAASSKINTLIAVIKNANSVTNIVNIQSFTNAMKSLGKMSVNGFIKEFTSADSRVSTAISSFCNQALTKIKLFNTSFYTAGNNATTGFINGLMTKVNNGDVYGAGYAIGNKAYQAARKALDEHSPSKKMAEVGKYAVEGFLNGIKITGVKIGTVTDAVFTNFVAKALDSVTATKSAESVVKKYANTYVTSTKKVKKQLKEATKVLAAYAQQVYKSSDYYKDDKKNLKDHLKQLRSYYKERDELNSKSSSSDTQKSLKENAENIEKMKKQINKDQEQIVKNTKKALNEVKQDIKDAVKEYLDIFSVASKEIDLFASLDSSIKETVKSALVDNTALSNFSLDTGIDILEEFSSSAQDLADSVQTARDNLTSTTEDLEEAEKELQEAQTKSLAVNGRSQKYLDAIAEAETKVAEAKEANAEAQETLNELTKSSGSEIVENMKSNVDAFNEWRENLEKLSKLDISDSLYKYLKGLGISGSEQVASFVSMTESELSQANAYWEQYSSMSTKTLVDGMNDKAAAMLKWGENIKKFASLDINSDVKLALLDEFETQGIDSADYLNQILSMTASELEEFVNSYKTIISIPEQVAEQVAKSIEDVTDKTKTSKQEMLDYIDTMRENLKAEQEYEKNLKALKKNGISDGLYDQLVSNGDKQLIASFANASKEDIKEANSIFAQSAKLTANAWLDSYESQITDEKEWTENMKAFAKLKIPTKMKETLYEQFKEKNTESNELLTMILGFNNKQLKRFIKDWKATNSVSTSIADEIVAGSASVSEETQENLNKSMKNTAKKAMNALNNEIEAQTPKVKKTASTAGSGVVKAVQNHVNKKTGKETTTQYCNGLVEGFEGKTSDVKKAAKKVAKDNILDTIKGIFNINSPSKEAIKIGEFIDEGLAIGLSNYSYTSENAAESMSEDVLGMMQNAITRAAQWANSGVDASPTIRPILDMSELQKQASSINGMFGSETIGVNANMASGIASRMNASLGSQNGSTTNNSYDQSTQTINNTFHVTGDNPKEIANEVSKILQKQVNRRSVTWA